jgi:hypothetical protein
MNVVFSRQVAEQLKDKYLVLEMETFKAGDADVETFCVVGGDSIPQTEMPTLKHYEQLHIDFVAALKQGRHNFCLELVPHLRGKFGGELDSFYDVIYERLTGNKTV